jgi:hypothetical protein
LVRRVFEAYPRRFAVSLLLDEEIARSRSDHFIQNASKFDYLYGLVPTATANPIENSATSLWFIGYSKRTPDALPLVCFWMKKSQGQEPRSGHFIQNASKFDYLYGLIATATANPIANSATSLWFVGYYKRTPDALLLVCFWMKQSQGPRSGHFMQYLCNFYYQTVTCHNT